VRFPDEAIDAGSSQHLEAMTAVGRRVACATAFVLAGLASAGALADESAAEWLTRVGTAARLQNYSGIIVYQYGNRAETSRIVHLNERGEELEKLVSLEGPAREVIRTQGEVRCYYPDAKFVRIEPRTFRNAFPSLSPQQRKTLAEYYDFRMAEIGRVAGRDVQAWVFEPKDGLRYGHTFWADSATGLLLKARTVDERNAIVEQFTFTEVTIGGPIDRDMVKPTWAAPPPDWRTRRLGAGEVDMKDTGWVVTRVPPGFVKIVEGFRQLRGVRDVAHLVYSDGLVTVSVFVEPIVRAPHPIGYSAQGGVNVYVRQVDDNLVTVLGEAPAVTVRQIANSVARR
jgi:sigma-E factor negative regulatory protein RseB